MFTQGTAVGVLLSHIGELLPAHSLSIFRGVNSVLRPFLYPTLIAALVARVQHANGNVRRAAVRALGQIARRGDTRAIAAVAARAEDEEVGVRRAAVNVLWRIAEKGNAVAFAAVASRLADPDRGIKSAAQSALERVETGLALAVTVTVDALGLRLGRAGGSTSAPPTPRWSDDRRAVNGSTCDARRAVLEFARQGSAAAVSLVAELLAHADARARCAAVNALLKLASGTFAAAVASGGIPGALGAIARRLESPDAAMRSAAVRDLGGIADEGVPGLAAVIIARLEDKDCHVRTLVVVMDRYGRCFYRYTVIDNPNSGRSVLGRIEADFCW